MERTARSFNAVTTGTGDRSSNERKLLGAGYRGLARHREVHEKCVAQGTGNVKQVFEKVRVEGWMMGSQGQKLDRAKMEEDMTKEEVKEEGKEVKKQKTMDAEEKTFPCLASLEESQENCKSEVDEEDEEARNRI